MNPMMMISGKFLKLDDEYDLDYEGSIAMNIDFVLTDYMPQFKFYYDNTRELVKDLTKAVMETIEFYNEQKKARNNE